MEPEGSIPSNGDYAVKKSIVFDWHSRFEERQKDMQVGSQKRKGQTEMWT
jgi:hypothetical protein